MTSKKSFFMPFLIVGGTILSMVVLAIVLVGAKIKTDVGTHQAVQSQAARHLLLLGEDEVTSLSCGIGSPTNCEAKRTDGTLILLSCTLEGCEQ